MRNGLDPEKWRHAGEAALFARPRRALLLSRTPRRPAPATPWVAAVRRAVETLVSGGEVLVTGAERAPEWVALAACRQYGGAALTVCAAAPSAARLSALEALLPEHRLLVWPREDTDETTAAALPLRDHILAECADRAHAIHVRKTGNMAMVAERLRARDCEVTSHFSVPAPKPEKLAAMELKFAVGAAPAAWPWLTHYTREPDGLWPGETLAEYAQWLAWGPREARRDACDALRRMLVQRRIVASGRLLPGGAPMVSFTACPVEALGALMRWRPGLRRWTMRPYGLAVRREALEALGARPVRYAAEAELEGLTEVERRFAQRDDWAHEAEWRVPGDVDLRMLPAQALRVVALNADEAARLHAEFGIEALALNG